MFCVIKKIINSCGEMRSRSIKKLRKINYNEKYKKKKKKNKIINIKNQFNKKKKICIVKKCCKIT